MEISFVSPPDAPPTEPTVTISDDPTCVVCEAPLTYSGKGPKPKYCAEHRKTSRAKSTPRRSAKDVEAAMAALDGGHVALTYALMLASGEAAQAWEASKPALDERNRTILEADPALAKRLASTASKGGGVALVISHLAALAPAATIAYSSYRQARHEARQYEAPAAPHETDTVLDPDVAFRNG